MARTQFVTHEDRQIVLMDFSRIADVDEALQAIEEARRFVAAQPRRKNLLTLVDITDSVTDDRVVEAMKKLAVHDKPWVLAGAVVGIGTTRRFLFKLITLFSGRKLATFAAREDAVDWLIHQYVAPSSVPDIMR
jgi:hypothetical protein